MYTEGWIIFNIYEANMNFGEEMEHFRGKDKKGRNISLPNTFYFLRNMYNKNNVQYNPKNHSKHCHQEKSQIEKKSNRSRMHWSYFTEEGKT